MNRCFYQRYDIVVIIFFTEIFASHSSRITLSSFDLTAFIIGEKSCICDFDKSFTKKKVYHFHLIQLIPLLEKKDEIVL